jgi:hypothetical protein
MCFLVEEFRIKEGLRSLYDRHLERKPLHDDTKPSLSIREINAYSLAGILFTGATPINKAGMKTWRSM